MDSISTAHTLSPLHPEVKISGKGLQHLQRQRPTASIAPVNPFRISMLDILWLLAPHAQAGFILKNLHLRRIKCAGLVAKGKTCENLEAYRCGMIVIFRSAAMRSGRAGWVLNRVASPPRPKRGRTMQSDEVEGEMAVVGMRLL